jgi:hypothetical protein
LPVSPGLACEDCRYQWIDIGRLPPQDHFLTGSKMLMIVAVNPHPSDFDEARQALQYGAIAKEVRKSWLCNTIYPELEKQLHCALWALALFDLSTFKVADLGARSQISVRKTMNTRKPQVQPKKKSEEKVVEEMETIRETETMVEEWEEVQIDDLVNELESMRAAIYQLEAKNAQLEDKVREEVCEEMTKQIEAMEHAFQVRIEDERIATEQKFTRKLQIISREIARREEAMTGQNSF